MGGIRPCITSPYAHHTPSPGLVSPLDNPDQEAKRMGASHGAWLWTPGPRFLTSNTHPTPCTSQSQPQNPWHRNSWILALQQSGNSAQQFSAPTQVLFEKYICPGPPSEMLIPLV